MNSLSSDSNSGSTYDNNGAYDNFNLTRDLGNTYIHDAVYNFGEWNAQENRTTSVNSINDNKKLYPSLNPELYSTSLVDGKETSIISNSAYYSVNIPGQTKLMNEGYNMWEVGDRAYWDGTKWQNWKKDQKSPIKNRGVIQIQNDYIVAAKQMLEVLPNVMVKIGELDYCLPGPNPNYKTNSGNAQSSYQDWVGSATVGAIDSTNERFGVKIDKAGGRTYDILQNIYKDNPNVWTTILGTTKDGVYTGMQNWIHEFSVICDRGESGSNCTGSYFYAKKGDMNKYQAQHYAAKSDLKEITLNYVNNKQFPNFYKVFDTTMDNLYFKSVINKYLETEDSSKLTPNPSYIKMAEEGYDLTKDILSYSDDIAGRIKEYNDATIQAKINISKLEPIKLEVSGIIKAAQDRRKINLDKLISAPNDAPIKACADLRDKCYADFAVSTDPTDDYQKVHGTCDNIYDTCIINKTKSHEIKTEAELQEAYKSCLLEEDVQFYDAEGIMAMGSPDSERCTDGIDNDLNGLVDCKDTACSKDPSCSEVNKQTYKCLAVNDYTVNSYLSDTDCGDGKCLATLRPNKFTTTPCEMRTTQANCAATSYTYGSNSYHQNWFDPYRTYKVKSCLYAAVAPTKGQCQIKPGTETEVHSYINDLTCTDDKCKGVLALGSYSPSSCDVRGPVDCKITKSIVSGPTRVRSGFLGLDPYNKYTVNECDWKNN